MQDCEFMEVDDAELPCLSVLKAAPVLKAAHAQQTISFFKSEPADFQLPTPTAPRQQQTTQPTCPPDEIAASPPSVAENGACAPTIEGFDEIESSSLAGGLQFLPPDEVGLYLASIQQTQGCGEDAHAPSVPEVPEPQIHLRIVPAPRERLTTISLVASSEAEVAILASGCHCDQSEDSSEINQIIDQLMDNEAGHVTDIPCAHVKVQPCVGAVKDHRVYDDTATYILELHQAIALDVPHAKKKPMLHEFLGYILFRQEQDERLRGSVLHGSVYFCRENGDRMDRPRRPETHFRVAKFQAVSEVWKRIKCNSSKDCTKNMKRAMRMSTTNERDYFVNLTQRQHRLQVFKFGDRSMDYFKRVFSAWFPR